MNSNMIIGALVVAGVVFSGFQWATVRSTGDTEQRPYTVLESEGAFEIRYYPPVVMASYDAENGDYGSRNSSFRVLAGYIFGGNEAKRSIAMTSPVEMQESEDGMRMSFMMPGEYEQDSLPAPNDPRIRFHETEGFYAATLEFGGWASEKDIERYGQKLAERLADLEILPEGEVIYLGYNPPFQMVNRRNEVMLRLSGYTPKAG